MLTSVEEMLEGYEWASGDLLGGSGRGTTDQVEARLLDELMALEKANIHSFIESDDRVNIVVKFLEDAIGELDSMESIISSYKIHLNMEQAVNEDIAFIQGQDKGLQVQTQNQRQLLGEIQELIQTVRVSREALLTLTKESLDKNPERLEEAASQLYKALQAGRDRDMAATMERLEEYKTYNTQFCKRLYDFLSVMCTAQAKMVLGDSNGINKPARGKPTILDHKPLESYLERYTGLMLYLREMDESVYGKLCAAYFSAASNLHMTQVRTFLAVCSNMIKKGADEDEGGFGGVTPTGTGGRAAAGVRRAGTIVRSPLEGRRDKKDVNDGDLSASDAFALVLEGIAPAVYAEQTFIEFFLQINGSSYTFATYMNLENYFRRQAERSAGLSSATLKLVRGAMDLIFGFLPLELKAWLDSALAKDHLHIIGMIVVLEKFMVEAEERGNAFFINLLEKQHVRLKGLFDRRAAEHIKSVEDMKLTSKKRNGVAPFIKYFPIYVGRVENQLIGADTLEIRQIVDASYDKIVQAMFSALKQMAKMDGEGEDKGQLNYHVILIENMHHFVAEMSQLDIGSVAAFLQKAQAIYDENLNAYVKIVLRRPFSKIIDYFEGVERLLKTTAPSEVSSNSSYSKSSLKRIVKEYDSKDVRKHVDTLFKRVEKHFTEASEKETSQEVSSSMGIAPGTVMVGVWKACEEELLRITELFAKRIAQCYGSTGVTLEYTAADVEAAPVHALFTRVRIAKPPYTKCGAPSAELLGNAAHRCYDYAEVGSDLIISQCIQNRSSGSVSINARYIVSHGFWKGIANADRHLPVDEQPIWKRLKAMILWPSAQNMPAFARIILARDKGGVEIASDSLKMNDKNKDDMHEDTMLDATYGPLDETLLFATVDLCSLLLWQLFSVATISGICSTSCDSFRLSLTLGRHYALVLLGTGSSLSSRSGFNPQDGLKTTHLQATSSSGRQDILLGTRSRTAQGLQAFRWRGAMRHEMTVVLTVSVESRPVGKWSEQNIRCLQLGHTYCDTEDILDPRTCLDFVMLCWIVKIAASCKTAADQQQARKTWTNVSSETSR
ncbi:hypothetical protein NM688_g7392 [Phlebia brevispora]|uniref:Uncharacterized protein n=1 Tax=Phlebia brevispora TaxID=194682 RepID=A0ACC1S5N4_9APHY|nr:hypothetical protein NM688_g7392 [Phlebia brevispora]